MSYDIGIEVRHPDGYTTWLEVGNITYNVGPMVEQACGVTFRWFDGMPTSTALPILAHCWKTMRRQPGWFKRVEAANGWGTYDQFMPYLTRFYALTRLHPAGVIRVT